MEQITVKIDGMACGMCESHVCEAIRHAVKVSKVTASHSKNEAVIVAEDGTVSDDDIRKALDGTGYQALSVSRAPQEEKKGFFARFRK